MAWDYENELIWLPRDSTTTPEVRAFTTTGSLVTSFPEPLAYTNFIGAAYLGEYLWISSYGLSPNSYIWKVHCPKYFLGVAPASFGQVKALYR